MDKHRRFARFFVTLTVTVVLASTGLFGLMEPIRLLDSISFVLPTAHTVSALAKYSTLFHVEFGESGALKSIPPTVKNSDHYLTDQKVVQILADQYSSKSNRFVVARQTMEFTELIENHFELDGFNLAKIDRKLDNYREKLIDAIIDKFVSKVFGQTQPSADHAPTPTVTPTPTFPLATLVTSRQEPSPLESETPTPPFYQVTIATADLSATATARDVGTSIIETLTAQPPQQTPPPLATNKSVTDTTQLAAPTHTPSFAAILIPTTQRESPPMSTPHPIRNPPNRPSRPTHTATLPSIPATATWTPMLKPTKPLPSPTVMATPTIRVTPTVTVPLPFECYQDLPKPELALTAWEQNDDAILFRMTILNSSAYPTELFAPALDLPACGGRPGAPRTWVNIYLAESQVYPICTPDPLSVLDKVQFRITDDATLLSTLYIKLTDRLCNLTYESDPIDSRSDRKLPPGTNLSLELNQTFPTIHLRLYESKSATSTPLPTILPTATLTAESLASTWWNAVQRRGNFASDRLQADLVLRSIVLRSGMPDAPFPDPFER